MTLYIILAILLVGGSLAYSKFDWVRKGFKVLLPLLSKLRLYLEKRNAKKAYKDASLVAIKYGVLLEVIYAGLHEDKAVKKWVHKFIDDTIELLGKEGIDDDEVQRIAFSIYALISRRDDLIKLVQSFDDHENIEVKKITVVVIDVIGELYDLKMDLDRSAFKHVIVGLNRSLMFLKEDGYDSDTYAKIGLTLHRLRIIMKSYNMQKAGKGNLTIKQLHERVDSALGSLHKVLTWDASNSK